MALKNAQCKQYVPNPVDGLPKPADGISVLGDKSSVHEIFGPARF